MAQMDVFGASTTNCSARDDTYVGNAADNQFFARGDGPDTLKKGRGPM